MFSLFFCLFLHNFLINLFIYIYLHESLLCNKYVAFLQMFCTNAKAGAAMRWTNVNEKLQDPSFKCLSLPHTQKQAVKAVS